MVTLHEVITFLVSMQISISSLQTHNVNRCGRSRHLARKLSLRRKRSSPNVFEMAATETITSIILIKLIRVSLGTVRHPRRFKIVVIDIQITLKQMLRDFIGIRVNRAKKSGMVNITNSVNSRERSGINTILHELNPLFTINVTMREVWLTPDLRIKKSLLKCNWTIRKRLPRCKMRLKKRLLAFSRRLHARIRKTRYMHKMRCLLINRRSLLLALRLLWKTPIFPSNSRFPRLCAKCLLKLKR